MEEEIEQILESAAEADQELRVQLEAAEALVQQYKDRLQRAQAEHLNYKRRMEQEQRDRVRQAGARLIESLLTILDDLDRALESRPNTQQDKIWTEGVGLIRDKFMSVMGREGLNRIDAVGLPFDPNLHEAVASQLTENAPEGTVLTVHQQGYKLNDVLLRPAKVTVAKRIGPGQTNPGFTNRHYA